MVGWMLTLEVNNNPRGTRYSVHRWKFSETRSTDRVVSPQRFEPRQVQGSMPPHNRQTSGAARARISEARTTKLSSHTCSYEVRSTYTTDPMSSRKVLAFFAGFWFLIRIVADQSSASYKLNHH